MFKISQTSWLWQTFVKLLAVSNWLCFSFNHYHHMVIIIIQWKSKLHDNLLNEGCNSEVCNPGLFPPSSENAVLPSLSLVLKQEVWDQNRSETKKEWYFPFYINRHTSSSTQHLMLIGFKVRVCHDNPKSSTNLTYISTESHFFPDDVTIERTKREQRKREATG